MKLSLVAVALVLAPSVVEAADTRPPPIRRAPPPVPYYDWSGFYLGAHAGFGWTDSEFSETGFVGGGQVGFNYQIGPAVLGVEGTFSGTGIKNSVGDLEERIDWISTLAFRAGWAFDRWLVYGKVGGAWANFNASVSGEGSVDDTVSGLLLGVGAEYAFQNNWSAKVEYNFMDFGNDASFLIDGGNVHVVKFGVNYRFGVTPFGPPPRVTKY